jgi:hypothetical protein
MTVTTINNNHAITLLNFYKIIKDLIIDLNTSFGDKISVKIANNSDYQTIINYELPNYCDDINIDEYVSTIDLTTINNEFFDSLDTIYNYCRETFALRSIDILYQNEDIFLNKSNVKKDVDLEDKETSINTVFLPDIEFADLYYDDTSVKTKQTLWKYLQVILFNIITSIDDVSFFGNSLELLKIIDSNKFSSKLESTISELSKMFSFKSKTKAKKNKDKKEDDKDEDDEDDKDEEDQDEEEEEEEDEEEDEDEDENENKKNENKKRHSKKNNMFPDIDITKMFDVSNNMSGLFDEMLNDLSSNFNNFKNENFKNEEQSESNNNDYAIPDKDELFSHINKLINGKIGSLAKEIAEETTKDLDIENVDNMNDVNDVIKGFMKDPTKLMGLIKNINNKISSKMKDGSLKESELLEEAAGIFKNMKNIPGMENFNDILKSMNLDKLMPKGGKINPNAFQNMMEQNVKMSKMRERMKKKAETGNAGNTGNESTMNYGKNYESKKAPDTKTTSADNVKLDTINANLSSLMKDMNNNTSFIDSFIKNQTQINAAKQVSVRNNEENSKRRENNKKKVNRKK